MDNQTKSSSQQILIGLMATLVLAGGLFYLSQTVFKPKTTTAPESQINVDQDTSAWRTYQNDKLNFSIKFPPDTIVSENIKTGQISFPFSKKCSLDICEGVYISRPQASPSAVPKVADFDHQTSQVKKDNKIYTFDLYTTKEKSDQNIKNFNLMLKTFKFLK